MNSAGFGTTSASDIAPGQRSGAGTGTNFGSGTDTDICPTCGHNRSMKGLEQFLGKLGLSEDMVRTLRSSLDNVDLDEYLNTARDYLKTGSSKAQAFAKENPGKVAAGVAVLAIGAGMLVNSLRD
jgi:hypothetical protein